MAATLTKHREQIELLQSKGIQQTDKHSCCETEVSTNIQDDYITSIVFDTLDKNNKKNCASFYGQNSCFITCTGWTRLCESGVQSKEGYCLYGITSA